MKEMEILSDKLLFISDVHLGGFTEDTDRKLEQELIHLIDYCMEYDYRIFILGDLFDYWMEYPNHKPALGEDILERFKAFNNSRDPAVFITGNHDNWTNGYFKSLKFDVEKNHRKLQTRRANILLLHGDGLDDPSFRLPRPLMHKVLRDPLFIRIYQTLLPAELGLKLMKWFSRWMRSREQTGLEEIRLNKWSKTELKSSDTDVIICGHDHSPRVIKYDFGTFINLGTFYQHKTIATYNNGKFSLVVWDNAVRQLKPFYTGT